MESSNEDFNQGRELHLCTSLWYRISVLASSWKDSELHENLASVSTRSCVQAGLPSVWAVKYTLFCCVAVEKEFGKTNHEKIHK